MQPGDEFFSGQPCQMVHTSPQEYIHRLEPSLSCIFGNDQKANRNESYTCMAKGLMGGNNGYL